MMESQTKREENISDDILNILPINREADTIIAKSEQMMESQTKREENISDDKNLNNSKQINGQEMLRIIETNLGIAPAKNTRLQGATIFPTDSVDSTINSRLHPWQCSLRTRGFRGRHRCGVTLLSGFILFQSNFHSTGRSKIKTICTFLDASL